MQPPQTLRVTLMDRPRGPAAAQPPPSFPMDTHKQSAEPLETQPGMARPGPLGVVLEPPPWLTAALSSKNTAAQPCQKVALLPSGSLPLFIYLIIYF